ncbi:HEPN domain-containing protein [Burkholderia vietnamiensis]|uniref:HEPN domain-containing protein n=1 Tax=Burkholderia vietnamiensis TaxID=60552 RepID=UPI000A561866|nr:HEPN domain-containing protein [Burkholderia vietnamiensis]
MNHPLQNDDLKKSLSNKLNGALRNCAKGSGHLNLWSNHLDQFYKNTLKALSEWVSEDDIREIIYTQTVKLLDSDDVFNKNNKALDSIINEEIARDLSTRIIEKLESLPRPYSFKFPAPSLEGLSGIVELGASVRLIPGKELDLENFDLKHRSPMISVEACGYAQGSQHNSAARNALAKLKVVCTIGQLFGLFTSRPGHNPMAFDLFGVKTKSIFLANIDESKTNLENIGAFELGLGISNYLNNLFLCFLVGAPEYAEKMEQIKLAIELMNNPDVDVNVRSIRRALEWSFDSAIDEDTTTSFVKTCIGLEAVLAEQSQNLGITEQLADRCAFILNKTTEDRRKTREEMREIYQLRSKIVHGVSSGLTHKETKIVTLAQSYLNRVLRAEISSVIDWWKVKQR